MLKKCYEDYQANLSKYKACKNYYDGKHGILESYNVIDNRSNMIIVDNFIGHFVDLETNYTVSKPLNYLSKSNNKAIIDTIDNNLLISDNHNADLLKEVGTYSYCYELYYIDKKGNFSIKLINPLNGYAYTNEYGEIEFFLYVFTKKFDDTDTKYIDMFTKDHVIHYTDDFKESGREPHYWGEVPVSVCKIGKTVLDKIKSKNDAMNNLLSDNVNLISDLRSAYLVFTGCDLDEPTAKEIREKGIIVLPDENSKAEFLVANINDAHVMFMIKTIREDMYRLSGHVDLSEKLQANTSGNAIRNRLLALELRTTELGNAVVDCVRERIRFLFIYLNKVGNNYNYRDVIIRYTPNIPTDLVSIGQFISQVSEKLSLESTLSLFPFIENPQAEIKRIKKERSEDEALIGGKLLEGAKNGQE